MSIRHHKQLDALNSKDILSEQEQVKKKKLEKQITRSECSKEATPKKPITQQMVKHGKKFSMIGLKEIYQQYHIL